MRVVGMTNAAYSYRRGAAFTNERAGNDPTQEDAKEVVVCVYGKNGIIVKVTMPWILIEIMRPMITTRKDTIACSHDRGSPSASSRKCNFKPYSNMIVIVIVIKIHVNGIARLNPITSIRLPRVRRVNAIISPTASMNRLVSSRYHARMTLLTSVPTRHFPLQAFNTVKIRAMRIRLMNALTTNDITITTHASVTVSTCARDRNAVTCSAFRIIFPYPNVHNEIVLPNVYCAMKQKTILCKANHGMSLTVRNGTRNDLTPNGKRINALHPTIPTRIVLPGIIRMVLIHSMRTTARVSVVTSNRTKNVDTMRAIVTNFLRPLPLDMFVLIHAATNGTRSNRRRCSCR